MSVLKILRLGHPKLRIHSRAVTRRELRTKRFQNFLDRLVITCKKSNGVGMAAPQVGVNKRIIIVYVNPKNPRYLGKNKFPLTIVINPEVITKAKEKEADWEGDLSADLRGLVPRPIQCTVSGVDRYGERVTYVLEDAFHARVFQHEIDHLDGKLFIDKVKDKKSISETAMWRKYHKQKST